MSFSDFLKSFKGITSWGTCFQDRVNIKLACVVYICIALGVLTAVLLGMLLEGSTRERLECVVCNDAGF